MIRRFFPLVAALAVALAPAAAQIPGFDLGLGSKPQDKSKLTGKGQPDGSKATDQAIYSVVKVDNPRATMESFLSAMNAYRQGVETDDDALKDRLNDAVATLDLSEVPIMNRSIVGPEAAIFLKEFIDRVILVNPAKIPATTSLPDGTPLNYWRMKDTPVTIIRVQEGPDAGKYLFSPKTVENAEAFYQSVAKQPYVKGSGQGAGYKPPFWHRYLPPWMFNELFGIRYVQWFGLLLFIFLGLFMRALVSGLARAFVLPLTKRTKTNLDTLAVDRLSGPAGLLVSSGIWILALHLLRFRGAALSVMVVIVQVVCSIAVIWFFYRLVELLDTALKRWTQKTGAGVDHQLIKLLTQTLKVFVVIFGVLLGAQNLGINVMGLIAGLGIVGAAGALAAQDTLKNFFGSIMIMVDRPFRVGDWVVVKGNEGTVEDIGFRSTRIRTFYNSLISVPNGEIATSAVDNMGMRTYRRYKTTLSVTYDTPPEKIEAFCEGIKNIIKANKWTRKDYFHVVANDFGASSIDVMLYMFFKVPDWSAELVERHNVICEIIRLAARLGVEFAFPTETLHIESLVNPGVMKKHPAYTREDIARGAKAFGPTGQDARPEGSGLYVPPYQDPDLKDNAATRPGGDEGE